MGPSEWIRLALFLSVSVGEDEEARNSVGEVLSAEKRPTEQSQPLVKPAQVLAQIPCCPGDVAKVP